MTYRVCITCNEACEFSLVFSILHVVVLEKLWTFVLGTKQSVRIACVEIHSFGSCIYLVHFNVCRKPGLAEHEKLKFGCIKVKVLSFRHLFTCKIMRSNWAS